MKLKINHRFPIVPILLTKDCLVIYRSQTKYHFTIPRMQEGFTLTRATNNAHHLCGNNPTVGSLDSPS